MGSSLRLIASSTLEHHDFSILHQFLVSSACFDHSGFRFCVATDVWLSGTLQICVTSGRVRIGRTRRRLLLLEHDSTVSYFCSTIFQTAHPSSALGLVLLDPSEKHFQLEESEDADTSTTEVFLRRDRTVEVGKTDGPVFLDATGTWEHGPDGHFKMNLKRTFQAGRGPLKAMDIGEFSYDVERSFTGDIGKVGQSVAVSGSIHFQDDQRGDEKVGYFNLIDTHKEELPEAR